MDAEFKELPKKAQAVLNYCALHDFEIVSYGLAPNPNGFCFESPDGATAKQKNTLSNKLDALNSEETQSLRKYVFG